MNGRVIYSSCGRSSSEYHFDNSMHRIFLGGLYIIIYIRASSEAKVYRVIYLSGIMTCVFPPGPDKDCQARSDFRFVESSCAVRLL